MPHPPDQNETVSVVSALAAIAVEPVTHKWEPCGHVTTQLTGNRWAVVTHTGTVHVPAGAVGHQRGTHVAGEFGVSHRHSHRTRHPNRRNSWGRSLRRGQR